MLAVITEMWPFIAIIFLLAVNGFFVALEFALVGSRRSKLEPLAVAGDRSAQRALGSIQELSVQLAGAQLGITIASLILGLVGEPAIAGSLTALASHISWLPQDWVHPISVVIGLLVIVFAHMVFGEMVPKNLTLTHPETVLRFVTIPNQMYLFVFRPVVRVLNSIGNAGVRLFGVEPRDEIASAHTAEELAVLVTVSHDEGAIPDIAADLLTGVLDFAGRNVDSVMVRRNEICAVSGTATAEEIESVIRAQGHTRVPVMGKQGIDDIVGYVHSKDLLTLSEGELNTPVPAGMVRRVIAVGIDWSLEKVLIQMQTRRIHLAVVSNADHSTAGIVTLDDLLEELVGDITDEDDIEGQAPVE